AEAVRTLIEAMIAAIPDMHYELVQILGAGNEHVVIRYVLRGTREGDFMGIAPSHNKIEMHGCVISEIKDGKRYRMWQYASGPGLLDQLGASKS
ncbi:MAG: ester cyclase, partial [Desulfobacteraceae bacterium]